MSGLVQVTVAGSADEAEELQSLLARARIAFREALEQVFGAEAADIATSLGA